MLVRARVCACVRARVWCELVCAYVFVYAYFTLYRMALSVSDVISLDFV